MTDQRNDGISWTDKTWNPVIGCQRVSEGCRNCWAIRMARRHAGTPKMPRYHGLTRTAKHGPEWTGVVRFVPEVLAEPLHWSKPQRVAVSLMGDLFRATNEEIAAVFGVMAACPRHTFQALTKQPARAVEWFKWIQDAMPSRGARATPARGVRWYAWNRLDEVQVCPGPLPPSGTPEFWRWPLPNVHLGVSIEDQPTADERVPLLLQCPAAVRWVSAEPLLGPVRLADYLIPTARPGHCVSIDGDWWHDPGTCRGAVDNCDAKCCRPALNWVVAGGEAGHGARGCHPDWARQLRDDCVAARVPFHWKQWGEWAPSRWGDPDVGHVPDGYLAPTGHPNRLPSHPEKGMVYGPAELEARGCACVARVGKHAAGRELDGRTWDEFPSALGMAGGTP